MYINSNSVFSNIYSLFFLLYNWRTKGPLIILFSTEESINVHNYSIYRNEKKRPGESVSYCQNITNVDDLYDNTRLVQLFVLGSFAPGQLLLCPKGSQS